ncbi:kinetochore Sim4 complex subunit FTA2-domain-containing protein [Podospora didyma]|uniref:Kinetochore Sim4 complex subunit FTA2-domain-containing protein n=1 Tax=Podospora didyma TaxID=330526 RepID=A0AAE0TWA8_9PEZI|nr:kinetochore Sim4 complex subunit FTA2-domain-containing protein [Podospora didyma]
MGSVVKANRQLLKSKELPPCEGPKIAMFAHSRAPIEWLELLEKSTPESENSSQGFVFKVEILSKIYALKVFKFYDPSTERHIMSEMDGQTVTDELLAFHTDPFYAECRAYGCIKKVESERRRQIAARCHGFMSLRRKDELALEEMGIDLWENYPEDHEYRAQAEGSPVRAIVKDFIETAPDHDDNSLDLRTLKVILKNVRALNKHGILHRDIRAPNFKAGLLVDFGSAWTKPHCIMAVVPASVSEEWEWDDLADFDEMVEEEGFSLASVRALPNTSYLKRLRSWKV